MRDVQVDTRERPAAKVDLIVVRKHLAEEFPELIETLFSTPVWLCSVGHGCVCGECEEEDDA